MSDGWAESAEAWIADMGEDGDASRRWILDPVMLGRVAGRGFATALDVGCGEGRFCRKMGDLGIRPVGIDPTEALIAHARQADPSGDYRLGRAEELPFEAERFDLVVSYLSLIDIADSDRAIAEMARILRPGGTLLVANLTSFTTACGETGWVRDKTGDRLYYPVDNYLETRSYWVSWRGIRIRNWHRPLSAYMARFLDEGLILRMFDEPEPIGGDPESIATDRRVPWFYVMEWQKPEAPRALR